MSNVISMPNVREDGAVTNTTVAHALEYVPPDVPVVVTWIQDGKLCRMSAASVQEMVWMFEASKQQVMFE